MKKMTVWAFIALVSPLFMLPAEAATISLNSFMDCIQADFGQGTCDAGGTGIGIAEMSLDTDTNQFEWTVSWAITSGTVLLAHFHGPALPSQNGIIQIPINITSNPTAGMATLSASQAADLLAGLWYINIHTTTFPSGEIRGQVEVVPVPASAWLFISAMGGLPGVKRYARKTRAASQAC